MSSQRSRAARGGARGDSHDGGINAKELWDDIRGPLNTIAQAEKKAKDLSDQIIALEIRIKEGKDAGLSMLFLYMSLSSDTADVLDHTSELDKLDSLYREQVKICEEQKARLASGGLKTQLELLRDVQRAEEQQKEEASARASSSRASAMDFDGPSDSPGPTSAENRVVRKVGASRTSSQPPRSNTDRLDGTPSEASERASKPKIVYAQGEEVAFKRKTPGKPDEQDWIQGTVVRVIGEGKSRRYDVRDDYPDDSNAGNNVYKSSASQMVPIPPEGTQFEDYEVGKRVLALYPATSTFYRGEVKGMLNGGKDVQLLFEEETAGELKSVPRRFVLDHKG
jgi:SAGA-associated factor 29